ncbi:general transcription factor IIH subunit 3 isoform X2 [Tripterygium wilfordii]|uniref:General transcription and DNA repair factor IIH subunit TFB4 n=1 Tax=Tripterygium wilfordii TaxID=458696 RepID=A0A7J7C0I8_TRIWF|nr:general transcription factor IIH subunit 3 isoform X2 [Tripterygium wilfordii]
MASARSKFYADDASLLMVLLDTNPFFWSTSSLAFSQFLSHVLAFLNSILLLNQLNQVVVIATGYSSCGYIYDSSSATNMSNENGRMPALYSSLLWSLEEFLNKDEKLSKREPEGKIASSLLSGSLSLALCYVQRVFRSGPLNPQARGSPDGPEQYVAIMNAIFAAQRSTVPIDSCCVGVHNSAFLQQVMLLTYITGGVYVKPQHWDGLFQYLLTVFATDLHSRCFLQLPRPVGDDFRASNLKVDKNPQEDEGGDWLELGLGFGNSKRCKKSKELTVGVVSAVPSSSTSQFDSQQQRELGLGLDLKSIPNLGFGNEVDRKYQDHKDGDHYCNDNNDDDDSTFAVEKQISLGVIPSNNNGYCYCHACSCTTRSIIYPASGFWFALRSSTNREGLRLPQIPKAYIRVKDESVSILMVKKYLVTKLGLSNQAEIDITCLGKKLMNIQTLKQIRNSIWIPRLKQSFDSTTDYHHLMSLHYQTSLPP